MFRLAYTWGAGAAFVAAFAHLGWTFAVTMAESVPPGSPGTGVRAVLIDSALFALFAFHHSVFARPAVKRWVSRAVTPAFERSTYVWIASGLLVLTSAAWQPVGGTLYRSEGALGWVHSAVVAAGVALTILGARVLSPFTLAGIDRADLDRDRARRLPRPTSGEAGVVADAVRAERTGGLVDRWPYSMVRHPIYLAWLLMVFGPANMTSSRFVFACLSSAYLFVAVPLEERSLVREFGNAYLEYKRKVRWRIVPGVY